MADSQGGLQPVNQQTTPGIIADQIRARIVDGSFAPGNQLGEAQLAARLRVSRGPVREALQRLVQEGLLQNKRNRGVFVIWLDDAEIADLYLVRGVIEREAARILVRREDGKAFGRLRGFVDRMSVAADGSDWSSLVDLDLGFHESLVRSSGSKRLQRMFGMLLAQTRVCLASLEQAYPIHADFVEEHRVLLWAMAEGDEPRALRLIDAHLQDAVRDLSGRDRPHERSR